MLRAFRTRVGRFAVPVLLVLAMTGAAWRAPTATLPSAQLAVSSPSQRYVTQVFVDLMGREPSQPVMNYFAGQIDSGQPLSTVVSFVLGTIEYRSVVVDRFFREYLLRPNGADPNGLYYYTNLLRTGASQLQVKVKIIGSDEYFTAHGGTNATFVSALYVDAFGRIGDPGGVTFWTNWLNGQPSGARATLVDMFLRMEEGRSWVVQRLYVELLGRPADPGGLAYFTNLLLNDSTLAQVITLMTTSLEYYNIAQSQILPQPPQAVADSVLTTRDRPIVIDAAANDTDADGNLNKGSISVIDASQAHGSVSQNDPNPGQFTYSPDPGFVGGAFFYYRICDFTTPTPLCDTARVRIAVGEGPHAPVATPDSATTDEDTLVSIDVLANDTDAEGDIDPGSLTLVGGAAHGTAVVNATTHHVDYTPAPDYNGPDSFSYKVCDFTSPAPLCSAAAVVSVTVNPVNDAPVANGDAYSVAASGQLVVDGIALPGVLDNDTDVEADALTAVFGSGPTCGTLDVSLQADGTFTFTAPDTAGDCTFTYTANDGTAASNEATVTITVS